MDEASARSALNTQFQTQDLKGFGCDDLTLALCSAGCLLEYLKDTQRGELPHLQAMRQEKLSEAVLLDAATRRNLEIDVNLNGGEEHTLFSVLDSTVTAMGTRHLRRWLHRPINATEELLARQTAVSALLEQYRFEPLRVALKGISDMERILARIALGSARPRDLTRLADSLATLPSIHVALPREAARLRPIGEQIGE